jgi:NAD(P)-dependent dehydrogenase (short-subunit alcohol dehydrogenase family)
MSKLDGKVFIVTGATSGMGRATAELFSAEGARLALNGRDETRGAEVLASLQQEGFFHYGDAAEEATSKRLVELTLEHFGRLDGLVCNAGMLGLGAVTELSEDVWRRAFDVNVHSIFYLAKAALPALQESGSATIAVNGSIAAWKCFPNHPAYCASKAAAVALARQMAADYSPGVRVNAICPGPIDTPLIWESAVAFPNPAEAVQAAGARTPMGRLGTPQDFAKLALFLSSEDSSWITGAAYTLDGGATLG